MEKDEAKCYLSALAKVAVFTLAIAAATVIVHESGHYFAGNVLACKNVEIVLLDGNFETYTRMNCPELPQWELNLLMASGMTFVLPVAIAALFFGRKDALIMLGFNLIISSSDFSHFPQAIGYGSMIAGSAVTIYGETLLADHHIRLQEKVVTSYLQSQ